jgi:flagellar biogenesis protein FliO
MNRLILSFGAALLCVLLSSTDGLAVEPAGGPPELSLEDRSEEADAALTDQPRRHGSDPSSADGSLGQRSWLARDGARGANDSALAQDSGSHSGFTLGAVVIVLGLGVAAFVLHQKRRKLLPIAASESKLDVLSTSRIGPKAYAVTAHVGGRVMLLGVTDHTVTHLCWIDQPDPEGLAPAEAEPHAREVEEAVDDLPDDYPGSALRAASQRPTQLASARDLKRFQEVLRGTVQNRSERASRPSFSPRPPNAAIALAAETTDVVMAMASRPESTRAAEAASLRRKRQRRHASLPPEQRQSSAPIAADPPEGAALEGQVAGLRGLRNSS